MQYRKILFLCSLFVIALAMAIAGFRLGSDGTEVTTFVRGNEEITRLKLTSSGILGAALFVVGVGLTMLMTFLLVLLALTRHQRQGDPPG